MENKKIDILMATYNGEKYLSEQIDSILSQTYSNFNLYIADDASSDNTVNILMEYEKKDARIKVFFNKKNIGSTNTFKFLLTKVKSEYYMLCDQDDIWNNNKIELSYAKIVEKNADLIFTDLEVVDENSNIMFSSFNRLKGYIKKIKRTENSDKNLLMVYLYNVVTGCTIISKKIYIKKILEFEGNKDIIHDHFIALIVAAKGKICYMDTPTIKYRQHINNQIGVKKYTDKFKSFDDVRYHLINVKISIFSSYIKNEKIFDERYKKMNVKDFEYFINVKRSKFFNFKGLLTFFKLYRYEKISYFLIHYCIFNLPCICKLFYNVYNITKRINERNKYNEKK